MDGARAASEPGAKARPVVTTIRRRIGASILAVAILAVTLFAVPLAYAASRLYREEATTKLAREASRAAGSIVSLVPAPAGTSTDDDGLLARAGRLSGLPAPLDRSVRLAVYDASGRRIAGSGPATDPVALAVTWDGREHDRLVGGRIEAAVPIRVGRRDAAVLASESYDGIVNRTWAALGLMIALALSVIAVAALLARRQAVRIAAPLEDLTAAARALGTGDFTIRPVPSGLRETDEAGDALAATAERLGGLLERERHFSADASHQIRTPLAALRLTIENALVTPGADPRAALEVALGRVDRVEETVDELLAYSRDTLVPAVAVDVPGLLRLAVEGRWHDVAAAAGREIELAPPPGGLPPARTTVAVVNQVLDVLVMNAIHHGSGRILVVAREAVTGVAVEISDEGSGFGPEAVRTAFVRRPRDSGGHGIGLALARDLAEAGGCRLVIQHAGPSPVMALVMPAWDGDE